MCLKCAFICELDNHGIVVGKRIAVVLDEGRVAQISCGCYLCGVGGAVDVEHLVDNLALLVAVALACGAEVVGFVVGVLDRKSTRLNSSHWS